VWYLFGRLGVPRGTLAGMTVERGINRALPDLSDGALSGFCGLGRKWVCAAFFGYGVVFHVER
jgi:hypothetical protein